MEIDTINHRLVGLQGEADEALTHAAHLVALAEPFATVEFKDVLNAVEHT